MGWPDVPVWGSCFFEVFLSPGTDHSNVRIDSYATGETIIFRVSDGTCATCFATDSFFFLLGASNVFALPKTLISDPSTSRIPVSNLQLNGNFEWTHSTLDVCREKKELQFSKLHGTLHFPLSTDEQIPKISGDCLVGGGTDNCGFVTWMRNGKTSIYRIGRGESLGMEIIQWNMEDGVFCRRMACGKGHVVLLDSKHRVFTFGTGRSGSSPAGWLFACGRGELGHGRTESEPEPVPVEGLLGLNITDIAAGGWHSAALSEIGDVYVWGWNEAGQLGLSMCETKVAMYPVLFPLPPSVEVTFVSCGSRHTVVSTKDSCIIRAGYENYGRVPCYGADSKTSENEAENRMKKIFESNGLNTRVMAFGWSTLIFSHNAHD